MIFFTYLGPCTCNLLASNHLPEFRLPVTSQEATSSSLESSRGAAVGGRDTVDRGGPPRRKRTMGPFPSEFKNHEVERKISEKKDRLGVADYQV